MCTVTYIPQENGITITSNRDEAVSRPRAIFPHEIKIGGYKILFPKDGKSGGTWIALKDNGCAAVLLNGAEHSHISTPPYRRSRGLILLDIIKENDPVLEASLIPLEGIEPFTLILFHNGNLQEMRWDGQYRHIKHIDASLPRIWSSSTLYPETARKAKEENFSNWLGKGKLGANDSIDFHLDKTSEEKNRVNLFRRDDLKTISLTQVEIKKSSFRITYIDLAAEIPIKQFKDINSKMIPYSV